MTRIFLPVRVSVRKTLRKREANMSKRIELLIIDPQVCLLYTSDAADE